jgi:predicted pyridoxine 5'-phosphate oxidase superfamily flavin-nucleotide-binding protein
MAKLTEEMKALMASQLKYIATASRDGVPSVGPKGSTKVLDDEHIVFYEVVGRHTYENIKENPKVAIAVVDPSKMQGFRFLGKAELITKGPLFEEAENFSKLMKLPPPIATVKVKIEEIYNLGAGGPGAPGDKVA